jgi:hypothetical protein
MSGYAYATRIDVYVRLLGPKDCRRRIILRLRNGTARIHGVVVVAELVVYGQASCAQASAYEREDRATRGPLARSGHGFVGSALGVLGFLSPPYCLSSAASRTHVVHERDRIYSSFSGSQGPFFRGFFFLEETFFTPFPVTSLPPAPYLRRLKSDSDSDLLSIGRTTSSCERTRSHGTRTVTVTCVTAVSKQVHSVLATHDYQIHGLCGSVVCTFALCHNLHLPIVKLH